MRAAVEGGRAGLAHRTAHSGNRDDDGNQPAVVPHADRQDEGSAPGGSVQRAFFVHRELEPVVKVARAGDQGCSLFAAKTESGCRGRLGGNREAVFPGKGAMIRLAIEHLFGLYTANRMAL